MNSSAFIRKNFCHTQMASIVVRAFGASNSIATNESATVKDTVTQTFSITDRISNFDASKIFKIPPYY